jgi:hypothetical protein
VPRLPQLTVEGSALDECMALVEALEVDRFEGWAGPAR